MKYTDVIETVANELGIPKEVVKVAYRSFWEFIKETIQSLPLKENINEDRFNSLRTNFNIPSLGKMTCTFERMSGVKKRYEYLNNKENKRRSHEKAVYKSANEKQDK